MPEKTEEKQSNDFEVPFGMHFWGGLIHNHRPAWVSIGNFETKMFEDEIEPVKIEKPIYICGLARAGSTLLLEILSERPGLTAHCYGDYPFLFTPYFWNTFLKIVPQQKLAPKERAHGDGIEVTTESPEAMEEMLWMAFFDHLHDPEVNNTLTRDTDNPKFEEFYKDHIRKLLFVRKGKRYLAKGNYNVTRLPYIHKIIPDARFVIPVRHPITHVASLMRQHDRFSSGGEHNKRAIEHLRRVGHFEFGLDRRPINTGDVDIINEIQDLWASGQDVRGWAKYWAQLHKYVMTNIQRDKGLEKACMIILFENLCRDPIGVLGKMFKHCDLDVDRAVVEEWADKIRVPDYYDTGLTNEDKDIIWEETFEAASYFGYDK